MAINAGTILAYLDLDTSKFGSAMQMAQSQMSDFSQTGGGVSGMLDGVGSAATTVGRAMTMGVTAPLLGVGTAIAKSAMGWETAFAGVRKTVNITSGDIEAGYKKIADGLTEMSTAKPVAAETLAGIAANAGQLGVAEEYILSFTGVMADLEVATNLTGEEAASMFAQYANITGMDLGQISNLGSTVVELGNNTATTERDIAEMMHRLAGAGSIVGLTDAQIAGMSATLTSLGINAEAGGSAMSRVLSGMNSAVIGGGDDLKAFADIAGVSSKEFASAWQADPINALQLFTQGLNSISTAGGDVDAALEAVGLNDIRITDMLKRLMGSGDMLTDTVEMANEAWEKNTALSEEAAKQYATTESKIQMLKNAVGNTAREFGNVLLPVIGKVVDWFTKCVQWVGNLDDGTKRLLVTAGGIAAAIGPGLLVGGKLLGTFSGVLPVLGLVGGAFAMIYNHSDRLQGIVGKLKTGGLAAFGGLKDGVAAYNAAIAGGVSRTTAIGRAINTVFGASNGAKVSGVIGKITTGIKAAGTALRGTVGGLGEFIGSLIDGEPVAESFENALQAAFGGNVPERVRELQTSVAGFANQIKTDFATGGVIGVMQGLGARISDALQSGWGSMKIGLGNLREKIGEGLELARDWLEPKARQWMANLGDAYQNAKGYVADKLPAVREAIARGLQVTKAKLNGVAKNAMTWLGDAYRSGKVQEAIGSLWNVGENIVSKFNMGKTFLVEKAGEWITWLGEALGSDEVKEKLGDLSGVASKIGEKIASGISSMKTTAATLLGELATQLIDSGFLSTAFTELAPVVTAIASGLGTAASNITTAATTIITELIGAMTKDGFVEGIFTTAGEVVTSIATVLGGVAANVTAAATKIGGALIDGITKINWTEIFTTAGEIVTSIGSVIISSAANMATAATGLMTSLVAAMSTIDWDTLTSTVSTVATNLITQIGLAIPGLTDAALGLMDAIITGIGGINWASVGTSLAGVATNLLSGIMDNLPATIEGVGKLVSKIGEGIGAAGEALGEAAGALISGLITWLLTPENWIKLLNVGVSIVKGICEGIVNLGKGVLEGAANLIVGIFDAIFRPVSDQYQKAAELSAEQYEKYRTVSNKMLAMSKEFTDNLTGQTTTSFETMANLINACALNMDFGLREAIPVLHQTAEELWNGLARADTIEQVKTIFAAQGYDLTGAMAQSMLTGKENILLVADGIGMSLDDVMKGSIAETEVTLQKSATEWGRIFGQAIPDGATVGLENGMYVLRSKTGEVIKLVSAVDAKTNVEAGNKDTAKAGVDAMSGELESGEKTVSTAAQGVSNAATDAMEPLPGLMEELGSNGVTGMATGGLAAQPQVTAAMQTVSDGAVTAALQTMSVQQGTAIGKGFAGAIATSLSGQRGNVSGTARSTATAGVSAMRSAMSSGTGHGIGQGMVQGVINGVTSMSSSLANALRAVANDAISAFRGALQMHSPSRLLMADGALIPQSYALGVERNKSAAIRSMLALARDMQDAWPGLKLDENMTPKPNGGGHVNAPAEGGLTFNFYGDMTVREEADIKRIGAELREEFVDELRGRGY